MTKQLKESMEEGPLQKHRKTTLNFTLILSSEVDAVKIEHELNRHVVLSSLKGDASDSASVRALRDLQQ